MRFMQIKQMLNNVCEFHGHLSAYYHQLSDDMDQTRIKLILDLLSQHEAGLRESLEAYEQDASKEVMNSWIHSLIQPVISSPLLAFHLL